jgi:hypothetical protein
VPAAGRASATPQVVGGTGCYRPAPRTSASKTNVIEVVIAETIQAGADQDPALD